MVESQEAETKEPLATRFQSTLDASALCSLHWATGKSSPESFVGDREVLR